jgi:hypothetical protein
VEKRETAVDMQYADVVQDEVTYQLPEGFTVESAPAEASVPWTGHAAFRVKTAQGKNEITVTRVFARGFTLLDPKEYSDLREYFQKVATADQQQLVLTTAAAPAAKGNGQ